MTSQSTDKSVTAARKPFGLLSRFRRDKRGSVAIEFSMLILPFSFLMFAVIETSVSFAAQQLMSNVTDDIARSMRTAKILPADINDIKLRKLICDRISILTPTSCPELVFDLKSYATYSAVPVKIKYTAGGDIDTTGFTTQLGGAGAIQALRVFYRWPIMTDFMRGKLSTLPNGKTLLYSAMVWKNEPYF
jgi:Flp pilus assembly protein TadG